MKGCKRILYEVYFDREEEQDIKYLFDQCDDEHTDECIELCDNTYGMIYENEDNLYGSRDIEDIIQLLQYGIDKDLMYEGGKERDIKLIEKLKDLIKEGK